MIKEIITDVEWSHFSNTCAIITEDKNVRIFEFNKSESIYEFPKQDIKSISWSYRSDILAIGYSNSILTLYCNKTKKISSFSIKDIIKQTFPISKIFWNFFADQICLISIDNQILILNTNGCKYKSVVSLVKVNFQFENETFLSDSKLILNSKEGEIFLYEKESLSPKYLTTILSPVSYIYCTRFNEGQILTISSDNIFTIFQLNDKNELKKLDQRKLNDGYFTHIEEIKEGKIVYSINDTIYITKSELNDQNSIELTIHKDDKIADFQFYSYSKSLAAITEEGRICIWSLNSEIQLIKKYEYNSIQLKKFWSTFSMAFLSIDEKAFSIKKIPKIRYINAGYFELIQVDSNTLILNSTKKAQKFHHSIEKIVQTANHFLIVIGSKCKIFNFNFECINEFPIQSNLVELFGARIFTMKGQIIEVKNIIDNSMVSSIRIESIGSIIKTKLNGYYLAILTSMNELFVYDISQFSIKQISKLDISDLIQFSTVTSIGISNGGFCVSITCRSLFMNKIILISTKKENENKKNQKFLFLNIFGQLKWDTETPNLFCVRTYEGTLLTYLIDSDLNLVQLKTLSLSSEFSFLKVSVPRYFYSPFNSTFLSVTSHFLPSFLCLDEVSSKMKKNIVLLMFYIQNKNFESALKLIERIDDQTIVKQFLSDNQYLETFGDLIQQKNVIFESDVPFSMKKFQSLKTGNLSPLLTSINNNEANNWYGRYCEIKNDTKTALTIYSMSQNKTEQVRLLCCQRKFEEAKELVDSTTDKSVICYFARLLMKLIETCDNNEKGSFFQSKEKVSHLIIDLLARAERYGMALEFAFQSKLFKEVEFLSAFAPQKIVYKVAKGLESQKGNEALSIRLYFEANCVKRAVQCAIQTFNIECLSLYKDKIQNLNDFKLIYNCAEYFEKVGNYKEAVYFYSYARCIEKVEGLCCKENLRLPEKLIVFLSNFQNESIARLFEKQGKFIEAAQIYTNLNIQTKALKALIEMNDIEKVIQFTKQINNLSCYSMAADYIVDVINPKRNSSLFQMVIEFYRKSENYKKIVNFLESRAKQEIDVSQNYEKALELLKESQIYYAMFDSPNNFEMIENITNKVRWIEMYIKAASTKTPEIMETVCDALINTKGAFDIIRYEDVVFLQIQAHLTKEDFHGAQKLIEDLQKKGVEIEKFIESDSIKRIYRAATRADPFDLSDEMPDDDDIIIEHFSDSS